MCTTSTSRQGDAAVVETLIKTRSDISRSLLRHVYSLGLDQLGNSGIKMISEFPSGGVFVQSFWGLSATVLPRDYRHGTKILLKLNFGKTLYELLFY